MAAAKFFLKTFVEIPDAHVKLLSDNTTTAYGINNMYSTKPDLCHSIISKIKERRTMMQKQNHTKK